MNVILFTGPDGKLANPDMVIRITPNCFIWIVPVDKETITTKIVRVVDGKAEEISEANMNVGVMKSYVEAFTLIGQLLMATDEGKGHA
mgnify:CR=1 FL=1